MGHLPDLIGDLALIMIVGVIVTLIFRRIKQPLVLGYIIAGLFVGPHFSVLPTVADTENVKTLAEIGVIFLLFSLGLEFSFKKLMRVGGSASITAFVEIVFITTTGFFTGKAMGWSTMDSLFLGGMLASSSTTIIIRAFDELGVKTKQFARVVFGVLVVEDIVVILLMVMLSTIAVTRNFEGTQMLMTVAKLLFFLILWFITGIFILPTFLKRIRKLLDDETLLVLSVGLCLGMVVIATEVGFSAELGAFIMGSILAETTKAEKVEHLMKPLKDVFGAVFFVSVGMLINPTAIMENYKAVIAVTLLTIFGKLFSTTFGALLSGQSLKQSIQVGMSMAQIGEFAFIVATLGMSLGVISEFLFPVAVGASALTTFTTPYFIKYSDRLYNLINRFLPERWIRFIDEYSYGTQTIQSENAWKPVLRSYASIMLTNGIMLVAVLLLLIKFIYPLVYLTIDNSIAGNIISLIVSFVFMSPFLWALMAKRPNNMAYRELWLNYKYNHGPLLALEAVRILLGIFIIGFMVDYLLSTTFAILIAVPTFIVVLKIFSKRIQRLYQRLEQNFMTNLHARETASHQLNPITAKMKQLNPNFSMSSWDAHIVDLEVSPYANYIGKTLEQLTWRETYGINIAYIKRGDHLRYAPQRDSRLFPFDRVGIIATDEQIQQFKPVFDADHRIDENESNVEDVIIQKIVVDEHNKLKGLSIRESGIREKTDGLVIGIERTNIRFLNPSSGTVLEWGDVVWIVGERKKIQLLVNPKI